jgi:hypothetical protein
VFYGATVDDMTDDSVALQRAIDATPAGGVLCIRPGRLRVSRQPRAWNRFAALNTHHKGLTVQCDPGSFIDLVGDQGAQATFLWAIDAGAERIVFDGCTLTKTFATNSDEQTHAWATTGVCSAAQGTCTPIMDVTWRNNTCIWPRGDTRSGDCIRLLGDAPGTKLIGVLIEDNHLSGGRSCVEFQRGVEDVIMRRNVCDGPTADQHADGEASGVSAGMEVKRVKIYANVFVCGPLNQGDYDISMTSGIDVEVYANVMCRGIKVVKTKQLHLHHQRIWLTASSVEGAVEVSNVCDGLYIHDTTIVRDGMTGPLIRLGGHGTETCHDAVIERNALIQRTPAQAVASESASNLVVRDNAMSWTLPAPAMAAVTARGTIIPVVGLSITANTIVGDLKAAISLQSTPFPVVDPVVLGNYIGKTPLCTGSGCPPALLFVEKPLSTSTKTSVPAGR